MKHFKNSIGEYPQYIFNLLTYIGVSRTKIKYLPMSGKYTTEVTSGIPWVIYAVFHVNSWIKGLFILGFLTGLWERLKFKAFEHIHFFDNIAALLFSLVFMQICIGDWIYMRRHPFFEVVTAGWKVQNEIHEKLGPRAKEFKKQQDTSAIKKVWFQWIINLMGISFCILQYSSAPKYCIYTNSLIEHDSLLINCLMGIHDVGFVAHAWLNYGAHTAIQSVFGGQFQHCLRFLTEEMKILAAHPVQDTQEKRRNDNLGFSKSQPGNFEPPVDKELSSEKKVATMNIHNEPSTLSSDYTIDLLIVDFRKLFLYVDRVNETCCNNFLFMHVLSYVQMTCDVFVIFQLLKSPGSAITDVIYFIEDCLVCMWLLFKCFKSISFVGDESDQFLLHFQMYMVRVSPDRMLHDRIHQSLQKVVMKLGPNACGPWTVGNAISTLLDYYIMVALWPDT